MVKSLKVGNGTVKLGYNLCPVCERVSEGSRKYCSKNCKDTARRERRLTRKALARAIAVDFKINFGHAGTTAVYIPEHISEFFPMFSSPFYVFARTDAKHETSFVEDIQMVFRMNIGAVIWRGLEQMPEILLTQPLLACIWFNAYVKRAAEAPENVFQCVKCKGTFFKSGLSASECAGICYRCCQLNHPF